MVKITRVWFLSYSYATAGETVFLFVCFFCYLQKGKCAEYVLGVRITCMCLSGDILNVGLSSGSVLLINLLVKMSTCAQQFRYTYNISVKLKLCVPVFSLSMQKKVAIGKHLCHPKEQSVSCICESEGLLCTGEIITLNIINARRMRARGLQYSLCVCVCVC